MKVKGGFNALKGKVAKEYESKGDSAKTAKRIGAAVAAKVGDKKYGKAGMQRKANKGKK